MMPIVLLYRHAGTGKLKSTRSSGLVVLDNDGLAGFATALLYIPTGRPLMKDVSKQYVANDP